MVLDKPLEALDKHDVLALMENQVPEGKTIEYKQSLPGNSYDDRKEFLSDVSSFANASGGHLIYGIAEAEGLPVDIPGLSNIDADAKKLRLENLLRDCIEPRIPGVGIRAIEMDSSAAVLVIRIRSSWAQPHAVVFQKHWRFYSRNSAGKYPLDVSEL